MSLSTCVFAFEQYIHYSILFRKIDHQYLSLNHHLNVVERFECLEES